jgi:hypothetical protein
VAEATTYKAVYLDEAYVPRRFPAGLAQYQVYSNECSSLGQADVLHRGAAKLSAAPSIGAGHGMLCPYEEKGERRETAPS